MRVTILSVGHRMPAWIDEGFYEYAKRMPAQVRLELVELKPEERTASKPAARAREVEGERLLAAVPAGGTLLALDENGRSVSTKGLSVMLAEWMRDASHPVLAIGGADGLSQAVKDKAAKLVSLSALTLPHGLVRVLLAEQIYRAWTIVSGHPYHRE